MDKGLLKSIKAIAWDSLTAGDAIELRQALRAALANSDVWFASLANAFQSASRL